MIDHIGIVCWRKDYVKYLNLFKKFGYKVSHIGQVKQYGVTCIFLEGFGKTQIEIIYPYEQKSSITKYLKKNKNHIHHIAFNVLNINAYKDSGLLKPQHVKGAKNNMYVSFLDPKKYGMLIELVEYD